MFLRIIEYKTLLQLLDYYQDLHYYVKGGYGYPLNTYLPCQFYKDIVEAFDNPSTSRFFFSHSHLLLAFRVSLGLFRDPFTLTASAFTDIPEQIDSRQFRISKIGQFANNVGLVLYNCPSSEPRIGFYHNEVPVTVPACGGAHFCTLSEFKSKFKDEIGCDFDAICGNNSSTIARPFYVAMMATLFLVKTFVENIVTTY